MSKREIIGNCGDCLFIMQEQVFVEVASGQQVATTDTICSISDIFVPKDGFCHCFEPKD